MAPLTGLEASSKEQPSSPLKSSDYTRRFPCNLSHCSRCFPNNTKALIPPFAPSEQDQMSSSSKTTDRNTNNTADDQSSLSNSIDQSNKYSNQDKNLDIPKATSFAHLVELIRTELAGERGLLDLSMDEIQRLRAILESYDGTANPTEWSKFATFDACRYTRTLVDSGNSKYNLVLMAWGACQRSPIHDHPGSHCIMKVLGGSLKETAYEMPTQSQIEEGEAMKMKNVTILEVNSTAYVNDSLGLHRVENNSKTDTAASLHLYTPPFDTCRTFCEDTSQVRPSGKMVFHKDYSNDSLNE